MARRKSSKPADQFMDMIMDLTGMFWQFGVAVSAIFIFLSFYLLKWAVVKNNPIDPATMDSAVLTQIGWIFYGIPIMLFGLGVIMGWKAFLSYTKQNRF